MGPYTSKPDKLAVAWATKWAAGRLSSYLDGPAYLIDATMSVRAWNVLSPKLFEMGGFKGAMHRLSNPSHDKDNPFLIALFDERVNLLSMVTNRDEFFYQNFRAVYGRTELYHGETWFSDLLESVKRKVPFISEIWAKVEEEAQDAPIVTFPDYPLHVRVDVGDREVLLSFNVVSEPFLADRRFWIIRYEPRDDNTKRLCQMWARDIKKEGR